MISPQVVNANSTYGVDSSATNNYGLGRRFRSTNTLRRQQKAQNAAPSVWWLAVVLFVLAVL